MKRTSLFFSLMLLFFILTPFCAWSADDTNQQDYGVYSLGEIVVSEEKPVVKDIAISNVITAEDIKATNSKNVAEALQHVSGIRVTTGRKDEPEISIHGFSQHKVLILIDGVPYYETRYGKLHMNEIPVDNIAKIEVVKGAPSVIYGPNAEAGVINIITKTATEKPTISANLEVGEQSAHRESVSHGMKKGIFSYWLNYVHSETDAWRLSDDYDVKTGSLVRKPGGTSTVTFEDGGNYRDNSDSKMDSFWGKFGLVPNSGREYFVNFHYINTDKGMPPSTDENRVFSDYSQLARWDKYQNWGFDISGKQPITDKLTFKGKLYYHNHKDEYVSYSDETFSTAFAKSTYKDYLAGLGMFADYKPIDWDTLRMAFHYRKDSHKQNDVENDPFVESISYTGSIALENEFTMAKNLAVVAGVSYDWFEIDKNEELNGGIVTEMANLPGTKSEVNPMIGFTYTFADSTKIFASAAKKTRFPTLDQLFASRGGNPALEAEESNNYTLGASRSFADMVWVELSFFYHDISNWISRDNVDEEYQNWEKIEMRGIELSSEFYPTDDLTCRLSYTYNDAQNRGDERLTDDVTNVPEHKVDFGIQYTVPFIVTKLDFNGSFIDKTFSALPTPSDPSQEPTESDSYWLFNARITQPFAQHFEAYIAGNNLFDRDYEAEAGYPGRGRSIFVGITARY